MHKIYSQILELFATNHQLKFSEIEHSIKIRSNKLAYYLEELQKKGIITKKNLQYKLTKEGERKLPILTHNQEIGPLPIVLIAVQHAQKILLIERKNRPYKGYWAFIGGKIVLHESIADASLRLLKEKSNLEGKFVKVNAVFHERVHNEITKHAFILFLTTVTVKSTNIKESPYGQVKWFSKKALKNIKIVPSDKWLIENKLTSKIEISSAIMNDEEELVFKEHKRL